MLRALAKSALLSLPPRAFAPLAGATVFYMHGLVERHDDPRVQRLHLTVQEFRDTIRALKSFVRFVSIEEALHLAKECKARAPLAVLTSDDGYVDNHDLLAPIAHELAVPWALFVSTRHIETGERFPTYLTRCFAYHAPAGAHTLASLKLTLGDDEASRRTVAEALSRAIYVLPQAEVRALLAAVVEATGRERQAELDARFTSDKPMTLAQVRALAEAGVEIGAHAHDHAILHAHQPKDEVRAQIQTSKNEVETHIGRCRYFAYPVGGVQQIGPEAVRAVRAAGFAAAFSTVNGTLPASRDPFLLPRVMLHRDARGNASLYPFVALRHDGALAAAQRQIATGGRS